MCSHAMLASPKRNHGTEARVEMMPASLSYDGIESPGNRMVLYTALSVSSLWAKMTKYLPSREAHASIIPIRD